MHYYYLHLIYEERGVYMQAKYLLQGSTVSTKERQILKILPLPEGLVYDLKLTTISEEVQLGHRRDYYDNGSWKLSLWC